MRPQRLKGQVCRCCKCFQKKTTDSLFFDLWFGACLIPTCKQLLQSFVLPSCLWPWTGLDCHQDWHGPWLGWCWYRLGGERKGSKMKDRKTCPFPSQPWPFWMRQSGRFSTSPQDSRPLWRYVRSLFSLETLDSRLSMSGLWDYEIF